MRSRIPRQRRLPGLAGAIVVIAVVVYGVGRAGLAAGAHLAPPATSEAVNTGGDLASTTTTTQAPPVVTPPTGAPGPGTPSPRPDGHGILRPGDAGPGVLELQTGLRELGYWLGPADGTYGELTAQAVVAFQKVEGLDPDGVAGHTTVERLAEARRPSARSLHEDMIEIDVRRQVLLVVRDGQVEWVLNTSTGAAATPTPSGSFAVDREIDGMRRAPLGDLYRPKYFNAGIAIHGYPSVPSSPASHGCARVSYPAMDLLWSTGAADLGTAVWVY